MPVATKIAPWASQESSAQLHNFSTFFFPTLRLSVGRGRRGVWRKSIRILIRGAVYAVDVTPHIKTLRDLPCDWYRINQCALHVHTTQSTFHFSFCSSSSSGLYLIFRKKPCTAQHEPKHAGGAYHKWAVDALSQCPLVKDTLCLVLLPYQHQAASIIHDYC